MPKTITIKKKVYYWYELDSIAKKYNAYRTIRANYISGCTELISNRWDEMVKPTLPFLASTNYPDGDANIYLDKDNRWRVNSDIASFIVPAKRLYDSVLAITNSLGANAPFEHEFYRSAFINDIKEGMDFKLIVSTWDTKDNKTLHAFLFPELRTLELGYLSAAEILLSLELLRCVKRVNQYYQGMLAQNKIWSLDPEMLDNTEMFSQNPEVHHALLFDDAGESYEINAEVHSNA